MKSFPNSSLLYGPRKKRLRYQERPCSSSSCHGKSHDRVVMKMRRRDRLRHHHHPRSFLYCGERNGSFFSHTRRWAVSCRVWWPRFERPKFKTKRLLPLEARIESFCIPSYNTRQGAEGVLFLGWHGASTVYSFSVLIHVLIPVGSGVEGIRSGSHSYRGEDILIYIAQEPIDVLQFLMLSFSDFKADTYNIRWWYYIWGWGFLVKCGWCCWYQFNNASWRAGGVERMQLQQERWCIVTRLWKNIQ